MWKKFKLSVDECRDVRDAENASRLKMLTRATRTTIEDYRDKRNFESKLIRSKKREMDRRIYAEMEVLNSDNRRFYRRVNLFFFFIQRI